MQLVTQRASFWPEKVRGGALIWMLFVVVLAAGAYAWWYYAPQSLPDALRAVVPVSPKTAPLLYKWRDDKGRWNVTDVAPTDRPYQTLKFNPDTNVVPSVVPPQAQKH